MEEKDILDMVPLNESTRLLAQQVVEETDLDRTKQLVASFNLNQSKKNVLRILKLESLLDKVQDSMIERFEKTPNNFNNNDLLNYMTVVQTSIDRANKSLNLVDETPAIQFNQQVNINVKEEDKLDRNSREKVTDAVKAILSKLKIKVDSAEQEVVDVDSATEENTVLLNNEDNNEGDETC